MTPTSPLEGFSDQVRSICLVKLLYVYIYDIYMFIMFMPTAGKPYVRFATFLRIAAWGGVGGHVNVPCTSCIIYCHVAKIAGIVCYVTCCYAAEILGTFVLRDMLVRC